MTSALYLEHYLDSLDNLPIDLQRNFTLMRDLDIKAQDMMMTIDKLADEYLNNVKMYNTDNKKEHMSTIQKLFSNAKALGDDKVKLAIQTYELVDKHIRRLDSDLARFEAEIQDKAVSSTTRSQEEAVITNKRGRKKLVEKDMKKRGSGGEEEVNAKSGKKKLKKVSKSASVSAIKALTTTLETNLGSVLPNVSHSTDAIDMPVDPNEPTYCLCNQVSYGEMIGCDNPDCSIEWFHFACVKLTTKPKGKWFCPKCISERKKK